MLMTSPANRCVVGSLANPVWQATQPSAKGPAWERTHWPVFPTNEMVSSLDGDWTWLEKQLKDKVKGKAAAGPLLAHCIARGNEQGEALGLARREDRDGFGLFEAGQKQEVRGLAKAEGVGTVAPHLAGADEHRRGTHSEVLIELLAPFGVGGRWGHCPLRYR